MNPGDTVECKQLDARQFPSLGALYEPTHEWHRWLEVVIITEIDTGEFLVCGQECRYSEPGIFRVSREDLRAKVGT